MLSYWCENLRRNHEGCCTLSARFEYEITPPFMSFVVIDWQAERSWRLENSHFNVQSRASLSSLRPSEAWRMNIGFNASGQFRVVEPSVITPRTTMVLQLNCEISWGPEFVNITGEIGGNHVLFSMRPPEGTRNGWRESRSEPPRPVFLRSDGTRMNEPPVRRETVTPPSTITPTTTSVTTPAETQSNPIEVTPRPSESPADDSLSVEEEADSPMAETVISRPVADATPMIRVTEPLPGGIANMESREFPAIQIVEETTGINMFAPYRVGDIPFSIPSENPANQSRPTVDQRPITIDDIPLDPGMTFDDRMATVRLINSIRLDGNYGTLTGNRDYRHHAPPRFRTVEQMRPQIFITPEDAHRHVPPPAPATPKPGPPPAPPRVRPPPVMPPSTNEPTVSREAIRRTLRSLTSNFHPPLRPISLLSPSLLAVPITTRTGIVNPPLPVSDSSSSPHDSSASPLRTTPEGLRLEITPVAMVSRRTPEETRSDPASSSRSSSPTPSLPPELDPEA